MREVVALVAVDVAAVQADVRGALALLRRQLAPKARRRRLLRQPLHIHLRVLTLRRIQSPNERNPCWQRALQMVPSWQMPKQHADRRACGLSYERSSASRVSQKESLDQWANLDVHKRDR